MPVHSMCGCACVWMLCALLARHWAFTSHPNGFGGNDAHKEDAYEKKNLFKQWKA